MYNKEIQLLISAFIINILFLFFQDKKYTRKYRKKFWYIFACIFGTNILFGAAMAPVPLLNTFCLFIILLTTSSLLYKEKNRVFIIYDLIVGIVFILLDVLMSSLVSVVCKQTMGEILNNDQLFAISNITILLSYFVAILIILKLAKKKIFDESVLLEIVILLVAMILEVSLVMYITIINLSNNSIVIILTVSIILVVFSIQVYSFSKLAKYYGIKKIADLQLMQSTFLFKNYEELKSQNDKMNKVFHDIRNHVSTLTGMVSLDMEEGTERYKNIIEESLELLLTKYEYKNQALEVIINNKKQICDMKGIEFCINIREEGLELIEAYDLTTILGNLLDNAIEESINIEKKRIEIRIFKYEYFLVIHIRNNCTCEFLEKEWGKVNSTKKGHLGIGMLNVKDTIKKYDGTIDFRIENQEFLVDVFIPLH